MGKHTYVLPHVRAGDITEKFLVIYDWETRKFPLHDKSAYQVS